MPRYCLFAAVLVLASAATAVHAGSLGVAGDYNLFIFNDLTQSSDTQGKVAVGHDANFTHYSVAASLPNNDNLNLIVGHNLTQNGGSVNGAVLTGGNYDITSAGPRTATVGGNYTQHSGGYTSGNLNVYGNASFDNPSIGGTLKANGSVTATGGGSVNGGITYGTTYAGPSYISHTQAPNSVPYTALPFSFADAATYLTTQSSFWSTLTPNGTATHVYGDFNLTGIDPSLNVFDLASGDLTGGYTLHLTVPTGSTVLINIDGSSPDIKNFSFDLHGVDATHILYNAYNASTLTLSSIGLEGTLLAPKATVNFAGGDIDGTLIANNLTGPGESHLYLFNGSLPSPPPPELGPPIPPAVPTPAAVTGGFALLTLLTLRRHRNPQHV